ncbi:hypothetical protein JCM10212_001205 [Sporobolomyces blumeae]
MESVHKVLGSTKELLDSFTSSSQSNESNENAATSASSNVQPTDGDLIGVTSGQTLPASDRGDAPLSGDIERQSGTNDDATAGMMPYNATGRDATGQFSGGANEEIPNLGAGEMPKR